MDHSAVQDLLESLAKTPVVVAELAVGLSGDDLRWRPAEIDFSFVEQACHLRDLELEGYGVRIRRLLAEERPQLAGFDGARVAAERDYGAQDFDEALAAFRAARGENVRALDGLAAEQLSRPGLFDGRDVTLVGVLEMMREHDDDHIRQLRAIRAALAEQHRTGSGSDRVEPER